MMTFKDLKKLVELPSYKEQRVPTVKALEVSGVPVVAEKMMVCVAIYAALIGSIRVSLDIHSALFGTMAYTVILCFSLLKTGSLSKQIFGSH